MATFSRQKYRQLAKGFRGRANRCIRIMAPKVEKSLQYQYISRKLRKREFRKEWIQQINAGVREHNINYSRFINGLNNSNINLDRKILANLCQNEPFSFKAIVDEIKIQNKIPDKQVRNQFSIEKAFSLNHIIYGKQLEQVLQQENNQFFGFRQKNLTEEQKKQILKK